MLTKDYVLFFSCSCFLKHFLFGFLFFKTEIKFSLSLSLSIPLWQTEAIVLLVFFYFWVKKKTNFKIFIFLFWLLLHTIQPTFFTLSTKKSSSDKIEIKPKQIFERNSGKKPLQIQPEWMKIMFRKKNDPFDLSLFVVAYQKKTSISTITVFFSFCSHLNGPLVSILHRAFSFFVFLIHWHHLCVNFFLKQKFPMCTFFL